MSTKKTRVMSTFRLWKSTENLFIAAKQSADAALRQINTMVAVESPVLVIPGFKRVAYTDENSPTVLADSVSSGMRRAAGLRRGAGALFKFKIFKMDRAGS
jgi:hypothetical protein